MYGHRFLSCFLCWGVIAPVAVAQESYSPYAGQHYPAHVYFGDTHLHSSLSNDAYYFGNRVSADDAYRFASGKEMTAQNGMQVRLQRPLDFLVVADHGAALGVMWGFLRQDADLLQSSTARRLYDRFAKIQATKLQAGGETKEGRRFGLDVYFRLRQEEIQTFRQSVWQDVVKRADRYNHPGKFSAFIGYEWGSGGRRGSIHRVVIFRDNAEKAQHVLPFTALDSADPEKLWAYLEGYQHQTGGQVLAIPHNGNVSDGEMFSEMRFSGGLIDSGYAKQRSRWEPLYEATQIKGDSEAHPMLSPTDEFAGYETWNGWNVKNLSNGRQWDEAEINRKKREYARSSLKLGLSEQVRLGVNPFKFGLIGSTDAHTSLSSVAENNFWGKSTPQEPNPDRASGPWNQARPEIAMRAWHMNAAGYAAIWAHENTRESLFAAMKRRETYATTGPRMTVRFFGGWDYATDDAHRPDLAKLGYAGGVPMGGDLTAAPKGKAPSFLIRAVKDADGANLDRVQVIKGWRSTDGELHEKIYNVALSDGRKDKGNKTKAVGSTVNVKEASYTNTIGATELATVWTDPDFKADELAFYYVRVLEIPTPRWTAYDAKYFNITDMPDEIPMVLQERAYTSPIWYTP